MKFEEAMKLKQGDIVRVVRKVNDADDYVLNTEGSNWTNWWVPAMDEAVGKTFRLGPCAMSADGSGVCIKLPARTYRFPWSCLEKVEDENQTPDTARKTDGFTYKILELGSKYEGRYERIIPGTNGTAGSSDLRILVIPRPDHNDVKIVIELVNTSREGRCTNIRSLCNFTDDNLELVAQLLGSAAVLETREVLVPSEDEQEN
jgi:hypothetical protein